MSQYREIEKGEFTFHLLCESCYCVRFCDIF